MSNCKFVISTDSCCDEFKKNLEKSCIKLLPMEYICGDNIYIDDFDSMDDYKFFYDEMKQGKVFSTSGLNEFTLKQHFEKIINEEKKDIVHISLSSKLSCTCSLAEKVAAEINENSDYKVYIFDSKAATQAQNFLVNFANKKRDEGLTALETIECLNDVRRMLHIYFFLGDLDALKRGGRISGASAVIGNFLQLRPVLRFNKEGALEVVEKVMGTKKAIKTLYSLYEKQKEDINTFPVYLTFSGDNGNMNELKQMIEENTGLTNMIVGPVGPVICSHTGPSLTGLIFLGKNEVK